MKVKDLIKALAAEDPEAEVVTCDHPDAGLYTTVDELERGFATLRHHQAGSIPVSVIGQPSRDQGPEQQPVIVL